MSKIIEINNNKEFMDLLSQNEKPLLIDFYAQWCGPCKALSPIFEQLITYSEDQVLILKVDVDANPEISALFKVRSLPTVVTTSNGNFIQGAIGAKNPNHYKEMINAVIKEHYTS